MTLTKDHNNHPAHAPLTTRRLHQMRDILSKASAQRDGGDIGYAMSDAVKLIDEVLARRAAAFEATFPRENPDIIDECVPIQDMETSQMRESLDARYKTMLEAAPQPAPVVPEPIKRNDADGWWMYKGRRVGGGCAEWYNRALDDCRASMLQAGNSQVVTDCSCRACRPVTITDMRFVVCHDCGNKRCPRANDHRNTCSGSNELGQEGSAYPAAPQQEVK